MTRTKAVRQFFGLLETLNWLQIRLFVKNRSAALKLPSHVFRKYMMLVRQDRWQSIAIDEIVPGSPNLKINLVHLPPRGLYTPLDELAYLCVLIAALKPRRIFEIGTFHGRTALHFALNSPDDCRIYTLDLPAEERGKAVHETNPDDARLIQGCVVGADYQGTAVEHKIVQLFGDSATFDFSPFREEMDVVFVDGAHHYSAARSDSENALRMVKPGGLVIWHDFANYGDYHDVTRAILDILPGAQIKQLADSQLAVYRKPR